MAQERPVRNDLPEVALTESTTAAEKSLLTKGSLRGKRNQRYDFKSDLRNKAKLVLHEKSHENVFDLPVSNSSENPAMPVVLSDVVVIGEVVKAEAFLSNDRTNVYSEFEIRVSEALKNKSAETIEVGSSIDVVRKGGSVRLASGKVLRRGGFYERMPLVGQKYLLFLKTQSETQDFKLLTGYELRSGSVFPLDGTASEGNAKLPQFVRYEGGEEFKFLQEVWEAIAQSYGKIPGPRFQELKKGGTR
jgi:hypothetical protein